jgi:hypothetical protein
MAPLPAMTELLDKVRAELRSGGVQLWQPPYTPPRDVVQAVQENGANVTDASACAVIDDIVKTYASKFSCEEFAVRSTIEELRRHAVEKLRTKTRVTLLGKVTGEVGKCQELRIEADAADPGAEVLAGLQARLCAARVKVIVGGRSLQDNPTSLMDQGWTCDHERGGKPLRAMFVASGRVATPPPVSPTPAAPADAAAQSPPPSGYPFAAETETAKAVAAEPLQQQPLSPVPNCPVAQVREAAECLTAEGFGDFELADASTGRLVPVPLAARQALVTAIALHARGREILYDGGEGAAARALEFLVEADQCFTCCRQNGATQLLEQLQNYGQLQLDICWAYARSGDADSLPDAQVRLQAAERMISKQVDKNLLTLAEVRADQGCTLTPEVIPSVRLWVLRGIAKRFNGDAAGARADLERARLFVQALKVDEDAVDVLLTMGATRIQAVAALRRSEGSADRAAADILAAAPQRQAARREREEQRKYGQTARGAFVDPDKVNQLTQMGFTKEAAAGALQEADNDMDVALTSLQTSSDRAKRHRSGGAKPVDELALCQLLSMGFELDESENALRAADGNVEEALMLLSAGIGAIEDDGAESTPAACVEAPVASSQAAPAAAEEAPNVVEKAPEVTEEAAAAAAAVRAAKEAKRKAKDEAREIIEQELGRCLRRGDLDDDTAGGSLEEEEALVQQHLSGL